MSLIDLKKKHQSKKNKKISVDDFIAEADKYAMGKASNKKPPSASQSQFKKGNKISNTKHATFTLSSECISQLDILAKQTGIAKSRIIRILVDNLAIEEKDMQTVLEKLVNSNIE
jgi:predicted DNA-binding protein